MLTVRLFTRKNCSLCDQASEDLKDLQEQYPHRLIEIDVEVEGPGEYLEKIPVIEVGPYKIIAPFDRKKIQVTLGAAMDRQSQLEKVDSVAHEKRIKKGSTFNFADRFFYWLSRRYLLVFNGLVMLYVGLAFLAPVLYSAGNTFPSNLIYSVYGRTCHQLAYRSWFLFGEQTAYPRQLAGIDRLIPYEEATGNDPDDLNTAISVKGNQRLGFKVALCQRDIAIYGSILVFGLLFMLTNRKIKPLPLLAWVVLGILPLGLDGLSQMLGQLGWEFIPARESTPLLRTITGSLFGFSTAWFSYPIIESAMADTRKVLSVKKKASQKETLSQ
jgi:uncharacterized membrane protein